MSSFRSGRTVWGFPVIVLCILSGMSGARAFSQDTASPSSEETAQSQLEEWKDTLKYGIDSQVIEVMDRMTSEKDDRLYDEILALFSVTRNTKVREASLKFFNGTDATKAEDEVLKLLDEYEDLPSQVLLGALQYLSKIKSSSLAEKAVPLLNNKNTGVASAAIRAVGATGDSSFAETLINRFEEEDYDKNLKGDIILALGELKAESAVEKLTIILEDTDSEPAWRRYACVALGKIGKPESLQKIMNAFVEGDAKADTNLRSYALSGAAEYDGEEVTAFLVDALKDSYWKVRISAMQGLAKRKAEKAVPVLIYKARLDPEMNVKKEAVNTLAEIGSDEGLSFLVEMMKNAKLNTALREYVVSLMVEKHFSYCRDAADSILNEEWAKKDSKLVEIIGRLLSQKTEAGLDSYFERFLGNPSLTIKIYGIRGIERNGLSAYRERILELSAGDKVAPALKKAALSALEKL